jgi:hypothetical protein
MDTLGLSGHRRYDMCQDREVLMLLQAPFFAFAALVTGVAAWSIWGQDIFPSGDPSGGE